jgi:protease I
MHGKTGCVLVAVVLATAAFGQPPPIPISPKPGLPGDPDRAVLIFLPQQLYSGEEFEPTLAQLTKAGLHTSIASSDTGVAASMGQVLVKPDLALRDADLEDYAGLVLVGGSGAALYWRDSVLNARCREFAESGRVVAAIGIAPIALARAGVLKGRKATVFRDRWAISWLKEEGARFSFKGVVVDRNIITAASSEQAQAFGRAVAAAVLKAR